MTKLRASYVCEKALATYAKAIGIDKHIRLGHGQMHNLNDTIIADVFEAVVGAIYLDQGFDVVKKYIDAIIIPYINKKLKLSKITKSNSIELLFLFNVANFGKFGFIYVTIFGKELETVAQCQSIQFITFAFIHNFLI